MNKTYDLEGHKIHASLNPEWVSIYSNKELWDFFKGKEESRFDLLVKTIKEDYKHHYQKPLQIKDNSLLTEIIVHVYCDYLGLNFNHLIKINILKNLMLKLLKRAEVVDCGETQVDNNRWIWDFLAHFKSFFIWLLPQNLNAKKLKK